MNETSPSVSRPLPDSDTESTYSSSASRANNATANQARTHRYLPRKRKHKILGLKSQTQRGNDPYDYEQKYPEDEPYQEMGPMARIWKVFLDECTKFDAEMTEDWKDALDVLLVFAGLFSAVVTTFLSQTSQNLQPDYIEFTASKISEVADLVRVAITNRPEDVEAIPRIAAVITTFKPNRTAVWVNGLWFTSLALSLTTALLAVLTKQWIHQYMSVPSGNPRDRSRIRQFRYNSLKKWRVPMIIGLLPVLMHVALGVFFAGLIVFLRSLDNAMSAVINVIAILGFMAYFGTNLLPLFNPDCPYKTPLTFYSHGASTLLWSVFKKLGQWKTSRQSNQGKPATTNEGTQIALSLQEVEIERVAQVAVEIEAECLSWLFNISSNSSVQRVVAQALSHLPLQSVESISEKIPAVHDTIRTILLLPEHRTKDNNTTYERLFRSLVKFAPENAPPNLTQASPRSNSLALFLDWQNPQRAAAFLSEQIVKPTVEFDVLSWAVIFRNALSRGTAWLGVHQTNSRVWAILLARTLASHRCLSRYNCGGEAATLCTISLSVKRQKDGPLCTLAILDLPGTENPDNFVSALLAFAAPSFFDFLWTLAYPKSTLISSDLPPDICLQLDLMRCTYIQEGFGVSTARDDGTAMTDLIRCVKRHLNTVHDSCQALNRHPCMVQATFSALCEVVNSDAFLSGAMTSFMKLDVLHALFRTLVLDPGVTPAFMRWLATPMLSRICDVAFTDSGKFASPLLTEILEFECALELPTSSKFISLIYAYLQHRHWLEEIEPNLVRLDDDDPLEIIEYPRSYPFLASSYIDGLAALQRTNNAVYMDTLQYIRQPSTLFIMAKVILISNIDRRQSILKLASLAGHTLWMQCCAELRAFLATHEATTLYQYHATKLGRHPFRSSLTVLHGTYDQLEILLTTSMNVFDHPPSSLPALKSGRGFHQIVKFISSISRREHVPRDEQHKAHRESV